MKLRAIHFVPLLAIFVSSDFINLDNPWMTSSIFHRDHGYVLTGHVIKTLSVFLFDCLSACQEVLNCFSINYADFHNGTFVCELNRSNKKRSPGSYTRKKGYEYTDNSQHCDGSTCYEKDALEDEWYSFKQSKFKMFHSKMSWDAAKAHCQSLGGDLASIQSIDTLRFIQELLLYPEFLLSNQLDQYSLFGGASKVTKEGRMALQFDGVNDYATVASVDFRTTDFTFAFWIYPKAHGFVNLFNERKGKIKQFSLYIYYKSMSFTFYDASGATIGGGISSSKMPVDQWTHVAFTWNKQEQVRKIYINSVLQKTMASTPNVDLFYTGHPTFEMGANDGSNFYNGFLSDNVILPHALQQHEIKNVQDGLLFGAWIGLNDKDKEGSLKWSDGQPLSYMPGNVVNTDKLDCVYMRKERISTVKWVTQDCLDKHPFICEKQ